MWISGEGEAILARFEATVRGIVMDPESFKTEGSTEVSHFSCKILMRRDFGSHFSSRLTKHKLLHLICIGCPLEGR